MHAHRRRLMNVENMDAEVWEERTVYVECDDEIHRTDGKVWEILLGMSWEYVADVGDHPDLDLLLEKFKSRLKQKV